MASPLATSCLGFRRGGYPVLSHTVDDHSHVRWRCDRHRRRDRSVSRTSDRSDRWMKVSSQANEMKTLGCETVNHSRRILSVTISASPRPQQQHGNADVVLHAGGGGTEEDVLDEAVSVGAHGNQVAALLFDPLDDLGGGVTVGQLGLDRNSCRFKLGADFL